MDALPDQAMPSDLAAKSKGTEPTAGPGGAHSGIQLSIEVHSRVSRAEIGQGLARGVAFASISELWGPCQGDHCGPVWVKSGPSAAKGSTRPIAFGGKGHLAKTCYLLGFRTVWMNLDGHWAA